jgi:hypothetical protein
MNRRLLTVALAAVFAVPVTACGGSGSEPAARDLERDVASAR